MQNCIRDIRQWMLLNKLKFNDDKTDFLLIGTRQQLAKVNLNCISVGDTEIPVSGTPVKNLGSGSMTNCH